MERLWTIMRKEFYHIIRDYRTLAIIVILPTFLLILLGYGVSGETKNTSLAVVDLSRSDASRRYIDYFTAGDEFKVTYDVLNEQEILNLIDREEVSAGILIPEDFGRKLDTGRPTDVQFYVNGSDPADAQSTNLKLETIAQVATQQILTEQLIKNVNAAGLSEIKLPITSHTKTLYNPDGKEKVYMIPGLTAMVLQVIALLLTALAIVREREQGTMEQLVVTPIRSWELVLGKLLPYLFVGIFNTIATLLVAVYLFGIVIEGNFPVVDRTQHHIHSGIAGYGCADIQYFQDPDAGYVSGRWNCNDPGDYFVRVDVQPSGHALCDLLVRRNAAYYAFPHHYSRNHGQRGGIQFPVAIGARLDYFERLLFCSQCGNIQKTTLD